MKPWINKHLYGQEQIDEFHGRKPPPDTPIPDLSQLSEEELIAFAKEEDSKRQLAIAAKAEAERAIESASYLGGAANRARIEKYGGPTLGRPPLPTYDEMFADALATYPYLPPDQVRTMVGKIYGAIRAVDTPPPAPRTGRIVATENGEPVGWEVLRDPDGSLHPVVPPIFGSPGPAPGQRQCSNCGNFNSAGLVNCEHCGGLF